MPQKKRKQDSRKKFSNISKEFFSVFDFRKFPKKKRSHFFINVAIGIMIFLIFHCLQYTQWGESTLDKFFDLFIRSESEKSVQITQDVQRTPIMFVDIDHDTYKQWGEPLITPRDKLATILQVLYEGEAKVIVIDILLEGHDFNPDNDLKLLETLQKIQNDKENTTTRIILPQRIGFEGDMKKNIFDSFFNENASVLRSDSQKFYRAAPTLSATASDDVVRYWNIYDEYNDQDGKLGIVWGYPIVAVLLAVDGNIEHLNLLKKKIIEARSKNRKNDFETIALSNRKHIKLPYEKAHLYLQRIRFLLIPEQATEITSPENGINKKGNLFQVAVKYKELEYYKDYFKDKIVIVGNSSPDAGDIHRTPVGDMAGIYILGNAINTILKKKQPSPPPVWMSILIEIAIIILAAYLFLYFTSFLAQIIATLVILVILGYCSYLYFLKTGVFLNFVFAVVGMGFHETIKDIEEIIESRGLKKYDQKKKRKIRRKKIKRKKTN